MKIISDLIQDNKIRNGHVRLNFDMISVVEKIKR